MVEQLVGAQEPVALACTVVDIGAREVVVEAGQHLVDAHAEGVEGEAMDDLEVMGNLRKEEGCAVETSQGELAAEDGEQGVGVFRDSHSVEPEGGVFIAVGSAVVLAHDEVCLPVGGVGAENLPEVLLQLQGVEVIDVASEGGAVGLGRGRR